MCLFAYRPSILAAVAMLALTPGPALAYGGPGLGLGAISTAFGVLGAIFLGIFALLWYPFKRLIRRIRASVPRRGGDPDK